MTKKRRPSAPAHPARSATLADVITALKRARGLSATRVRDLASAVKRVAVLLGNEPRSSPNTPMLRLSRLGIFCCTSRLRLRCLDPK